jgi:hypothetical protein
VISAYGRYLIFQGIQFSLYYTKKIRVSNSVHLRPQKLAKVLPQVFNPSDKRKMLFPTLNLTSKVTPEIDIRARLHISGYSDRDLLAKDPQSIKKEILALGIIGR